MASVPTYLSPLFQTSGLEFVEKVLLEYGIDRSSYMFAIDPEDIERIRSLLRSKNLKPFKARLGDGFCDTLSNCLIDLAYAICEGDADQFQTLVFNRSSPATITTKPSKSTQHILKTSSKLSSLTSKTSVKKLKLISEMDKVDYDHLLIRSNQVMTDHADSPDYYCFVGFSDTHGAKFVCRVCNSIVHLPVRFGKFRTGISPHPFKRHIDSKKHTEMVEYFNVPGVRQENEGVQPIL